MRRMALTVFGSGAVFNALAGLPFVLAPQWMSGLLGAQGGPLASLFMQLTGGCVLLFGVIYALIANDPLRYRPLILLGVAGKLMVVALVWYYWAQGALGWLLPLLVLVDALYSVCFLRAFRLLAR